MDFMKLQYSISGRDFDIVDTVACTSAVYREDHFISMDIDYKALNNHVTTMTQLLMTARIRKTLLPPTPRLSATTLVIQEITAFKWSFCYEGKTALLDNGVFKMQYGFNRDKILSSVNKLMFETQNYKANLTPQTDIVYRVPSAKLLVWSYKGHSAVCYEDRITALTMQNCLIDGEHYEYVLVNADKETGICSLIVGGDKVIEFPYDKSVEYFYKDVHELIHIKEE